MDIIQLFGGLEVRICKKVAQYDLDGNFIRVFNSVREASRLMKIQETSIALVCRETGKVRKTGGFMWRYIENNQPKLNIAPYSTKRGLFINSKNRPRKVIQLDDNKEEIKIWEQITYAAKAINRDITSIIDAIKNNHRCGGYYWKYYEEEV